MGLEDLLDRYVAKDDEGAMAELVRQTRPKLLAVARRICGEEAEDAVQTAYLSLAKRGGLGGAPVLPWLLTAVARIAYRARATRAKEHAIAERLALSATPPEPPEIAVGREEADLLRRELWKLSPDYRDALQLRYLHGLSGAETARLLGINDSTLRTRLQRGRLLLRSRLARVLHPFLVLPWLVNDAGASAALVLGGTMKAKVAIVALLLAAFGAFYVASRDRAPPPRARTGEAAADRRAGSDALGLSASDGAAWPEQTAPQGDPVYSGGVVVDEAGVPIEGVRVIARASRPDEAMRSQLEILFRQRGKEMPKDAHFRPETIDDGLRGRAPLVETDAAGRFAVRRPPEPRETLLFLKEGYAAHGEKDLGADMRVVLHRARTIRGVVTDSAGTPIPRAGVRASTGRLEESQDLEVDDEGRYTFRYLQHNVGSLSAWASGYDSEFRKSPGETEDFRLRRHWLMVDVIDAESKQPLATAGAWLATRDGRPFSGSAWPGKPARILPGRCVVGPDVSKTLEEGAATEAVVHVFAPGYVPVLEPVEFHAGEEPPHLHIALRRGDGPPALAGRVKGADAAHIVVRNALSFGIDDFTYVTEADTAAGGGFLFSGLPRTDYLLVVTAPGMGKVTHRAAAPADDIEIELKPAAILEVLGLDRRGVPVAGTVIHVELADGERFWTAKTDDHGTAVFDDLPAQTLRVACVVEGWNRPFLDREVPTTSVTPLAGARTQLTVTVPELLPVAIVVRDEAGHPHEGVTLAFEHRFKGVVSVAGKTEHDRLQSLRVTTDAAGRADVLLYQGEYGVMLLDGPTPVRVAVLTVGEDTENRAECVVRRKSTVVRGRLREYGSNRPLPSGVLFVSVEGDTRSQATARTDADGRFEIRGLAKRTYSLYNLTAHNDYAPCYCEIDLTQRDEIDLDLFSMPNALLSGTLPAEVAVAVRSRTAGALKGARVSVHARVGDGWVVVGRGATDAEGRLVVPAPEADRYRVSAWAEGFETADTTVDRTGQRTAADIDLPAKE